MSKSQNQQFLDVLPPEPLEVTEEDFDIELMDLIQYDSKSKNLLNIDFYYDSDGNPVLISGRGDQSKDNCGQFARMWVSVNHESMVQFRSCKKQQCPVCFDKHAFHQASKAVDWIYPESNRYGWKIFHSVISLDQKKYPAFDEKQIKNLMRRFVKLSTKIYSDFGCIAVIHPYRLVKYCKSCGQENSHQNKWCSKCSCEEFQDEQWKKGIHIHLITNLWIYPEHRHEFYEKLKKWGLVYKNLSSANRNYINNKEHLLGTVKYEINHSYLNVTKKTQCVRYYGMYRKSKNTFNKNREKEIVKDRNGANFYLAEVEFHNQQISKESFNNGVGTKFYTRYQCEIEVKSVNLNKKLVRRFDNYTNIQPKGWTPERLKRKSQEDQIEQIEMEQPVNWCEELLTQAEIDSMFKTKKSNRR